MFEINGVELDFDVMDADNAGIFETEQAKISEIDKIMAENISLKSKITKACKMIYTAIDNMFGKGTALKICGSKNNIRVASSTWKSITKEITKRCATESQEIFENESANK